MKDRVQEQALEAVRHSRPQDYDGHTEFDRMTPGQRLAWLDEATLLVFSHKKNGPALVHNRINLHPKA
jgi:hypothetical protein